MPKEKFSKLESKAAVEAFITGTTAAFALAALARKLADDERLQGFMDWEDIVQDTKLKMWRAAERFDGRSKLTVWGNRIMHNSTIDVLDKHGKARKAILDNPEAKMAEIPSNDEAVDPETAAIRQEELDRIIKELGQLSPAERLVLFQSIFQDQTPTAIAAETGINFSTVKSHKRRGGARLRVIRSDDTEAA